MATVGGLLTDAVTVTCAVPDFPPEAAVTVKGPPAVAPAVKSPELFILPPPETVHVKVGCGDMPALN